MRLRSRQREEETRNQIRANLTREYAPARQAVPAATVSGDWTPLRTYSDEQNQDTQPGGKRRADKSSTAIPAWPWNKEK